MVGTSDIFLRKVKDCLYNFNEFCQKSWDFVKLHIYDIYDMYDGGTEDFLQVIFNC